MYLTTLRKLPSRMLSPNCVASDADAKWAKVADCNPSPGPRRRQDSCISWVQSYKSQRNLSGHGRAPLPQPYALYLLERAVSATLRGCVCHAPWPIVMQTRLASCVQARAKRLATPRRNIEFKIARRWTEPWARAQSSCATCMLMARRIFPSKYEPRHAEQPLRKRALS